MMLLLFALGCAKEPVPADPPAADKPAVEAPAPAQGADEAEPDAGSERVRDGAPDTSRGGTKAPPQFGGNTDVSADPMAAYTLYRERLEGPEAAGECGADSDCATAGCSSEVCVPAASAADLNTTCEVLPVFAVLDACGCVETKCTWTVKQ